jgi:dipeptidase D
MLLVKDVEAFKAEAAAYEKTLQSEFENIEDSIAVVVEEVALPAEIIPAATARNLVRAVVGAPNGVAKMSVEMEGLVQTSNNLARVVSNGESVKVQCLLRSSVNSEKVALAEAFKGIFEMAGAKVELSGSYDGWKPNMASPIMKAMVASYEALYGNKPLVMAIHAGLECGIIGGVYPNLDMISFGPTILYPHSPDEKVEIASVAKFYEFLLHTLKNAPLK